MSDPLRVAVVAEGPTDLIVIEAALRSILGSHPFILTQLQPEGSSAFGTMGAGWVGVYRWCVQATRRGAGRLGNDQLLFQRFDLLILHIDADVAGMSYAAGAIRPRNEDQSLPCEQACPPASATTNALRKVLWSWCGEGITPPKTAICMPSKSIEAWVIAALFPNDFAMQGGIECFPNPEIRIGQQPLKQRFRKRRHDYEARSRKIEEAWPQIAREGALDEAWRFSTETRHALGRA